MKGYHFWHGSERLTVSQIKDNSEFDGMYETTDETGFRISVAFTRKLAARNAIDEIEYIEWHVDQFLTQLFGESA
jgi:hypothetical protein